MGSDLLSLSMFLLAGLVSGFCSSSPLGPINLWLVEAVIQDTLKSLRWFLLGVIIVDLVFAGLAIWGYYEYLEDSPYLKPIQIGAGLFLVGIGVFSLLKLMGKPDKEVTEGASPPSGGWLRHMVLGMTICGSNPGFLMFWLFVVNFMNRSLDLSFTLPGNLLFILGVALGDALWFGLLVKIVKKGLNLARPAILLGIRYVVAFAFLGCGGVTLWRAFI